jgi:excisionase family DNA binding protein
MPRTIPQRAIRPAAFADASDVHRTTVYRWIKTGKIRAVRVGGAVLIPISELDRVLDEPAPSAAS